MMNDNLTIRIEDFLKIPSISENQFTKDEILSALKSSTKLCYDSLSDTISLNYKAKRRIIVFRDIPKEKQNEEYIRSILSQCLEKSKELNINITKINSFSEMFYVYFANEEETLLAFRELEKLRDSPEKPFEFTAFVKVESLKRDVLGLNSDDLGSFSNIILDKSDYKPRKVSLKEQEYIKTESPQERKKSSLTRNSKYDKYDPYYANHNITNPNSFNLIHNRKSSFNKFDNPGVKRNKAYSIYYHYDKNQTFNSQKIQKTKQTPLNKNFQNFIQFKYDTKDMSRIYLNMNLMKKFSLPVELEGENFLSEVLKKTPKPNLEIFTRRPLSVRERSQTYQWEPEKSKKGKNSFYYFEDEYSDLRNVY